MFPAENVPLLEIRDFRTIKSKIVKLRSTNSPTGSLRIVVSKAISISRSWFPIILWTGIPLIMVIDLGYTLHPEAMVPYPCRVTFSSWHLSWSSKGISLQSTDWKHLDSGECVRISGSCATAASPLQYGEPFILKQCCTAFWVNQILHKSSVSHTGHDPVGNKRKPVSGKCVDPSEAELLLLPRRKEPNVVNLPPSG